MPEEEVKFFANEDRFIKPPVTPKSKRGFFASLFRKGPKKTKTKEEEESKQPSSSRLSFIKPEAKTNLPHSFNDDYNPEGPKTAA